MPRLLDEVTYPEAIHYLYDLRLFGTKLGLHNTRALSARFGNPQSRLRFIHVAGTNGKGSVCAMLESIYRAAGLKVGLFTSPHLVAFSERIQVNRQPIPEDAVGHLVEEFQAALTSSPAGSHPTFFEVVTVLALRYFAEAACDLVVWETGMGGRLDATNIVTPLASAITNIGHDHEKWLGTSLVQIAREKAGIIKPGVPVLTGTARPEALTVLQAEARRLQAPLHHVPESAAHTPFLDGLRFPLAGVHQRWNAALALALIRVLEGTIPVSEKHLRLGLEQVHWPGRLQTVRLDSGQTLLLDGAHNPAGFEVLCQFLDSAFPSSKPAVILAMLEDKDWRAIAQLIIPRTSRLCLVPVKSLRSARPEKLLVSLQESFPATPISAHACVEEAWAQLRQEPQILIAGSIYLVGEAMEFFGLSSVKPVDEKRLNDWGDNLPAEVHARATSG